VLLGIPLGAIIVLKRRRRDRRRTRGSPSQRVAGSFTELMDYTRDAGRPVPARATRHEQSVLVGVAGASSLATRADTAVFGPDDPTDAEIAAAWEELTATQSSMAEEMDRWGRFRAAVSPTSLRRLR